MYDTLCYYTVHILYIKNDDLFYNRFLLYIFLFIFLERYFPHFEYIRVIMTELKNCYVFNYIVNKVYLE